MPGDVRAAAFSRSLLPDSAFRALYQFGEKTGDGSGPTFLVPFNGVLYGTTQGGGTNNAGTIFSVTPSGKETILHTFEGSDGLLPTGPMVNVKGIFYGTTEAGASAASLGEVFSIDTKGNFKVVRAFKGGTSDGGNPFGGLVLLGGKLYGTTETGGAKNEGTVYSITTLGVERVLHSFIGPDGARPLSTLVVVNGALYGTTAALGGKFAGGTMFRITTGGTLKTLHRFGKPRDGKEPYFGALLNANGALYGTTVSGGATGQGTVFKSNLSGTLVRIIYNFGTMPTQGCGPMAGLIASNGVLYGTSIGVATVSCGGAGTVFRVTGSGAMTLKTFAGSPDGSSPIGLVSMGKKLYGVTSVGGQFGQGLFYSMTP